MMEQGTDSVGAESRKVRLKEIIEMAWDGMGGQQPKFSCVLLDYGVKHGDGGWWAEESRRGEQDSNRG